MATVPLNHPHRKNAADPTLWRLLAKVLTEVADNPNVRAVLITGADLATDQSGRHPLDAMRQSTGSPPCCTTCPSRRSRRCAGSRWAPGRTWHWAAISPSPLRTPSSARSSPAGRCRWTSAAPGRYPGWSACNGRNAWPSSRNSSAGRRPYDLGLTARAVPPENSTASPAASSPSWSPLRRSPWRGPRPCCTPARARPWPKRSMPRRPARWPTSPPRTPTRVHRVPGQGRTRVHRAVGHGGRRVMACD
jgi:hypothetical protein